MFFSLFLLMVSFYLSSYHVYLPHITFTHFFTHFFFFFNFSVFFHIPCFICFFGLILTHFFSPKMVLHFPTILPVSLFGLSTVLPINPLVEHDIVATYRDNFPICISKFFIDTPWFLLIVSHCMFTCSKPL